MLEWGWETRNEAIAVVQVREEGHSDQRWWPWREVDRLRLLEQVQ